MKQKSAFDWRSVRVLMAWIVFSAFAGGCATAAKTTSDEASPEALRARVEQNIAAGDAAVRGGDNELALYHYVRAAMDDDRHVGALFRIASIHAANNKVVLAEQSFRRLLSVDDKYARGWEGLGLLMLHSARQDQAEEYLRRAVELDATLWRSQNGLGMVADLRGRTADAEQHYTAALSLRPDDPQLLNNLGYSKYLGEDWPAAEHLFQAALSRNPGNSYAWSNLALIAARRGEYDKALDALKRVGPESQAYNNLGYLCLVNEKYTEAEYFLREAVRLSPTYYRSAQENLDLLRIRRAAK